MFENINTVDEVQEQVVDARTPEEVTSEVAEEAEGTPEVTEAEPVAKVPQTQEENRMFAELRRKYESQMAEDRRQAEAQRASYDRLMGVLQRHGYEGDADQVADAIAAQQEGMTLEQYQARKAADQQRVDELILKDPRYLRVLQSEAELREKNSQNIREKDAAAINAAFPDANVKDPRELGPRFTAMMRAGVSAVDAYAVLKMADKATEKPTPPDIGPVNGGGGQDHEYFSNEELDNLTLDQLVKNPKLLEKANRSVTKIGRKR